MPTSLQGPILLTGAAGFIGSHVAAALGRAGAEVVGVDNFDPFYSRATKQANLAAAGLSAFVEVDIADPAEARRAFAAHRPRGVIHLAAKAGVRPSIADPAGYMRANVLGTQVVLECCKQIGCERVVVASSSSVYGNAARVPFSEEADVSSPISPYAASKKACELIGHCHHHLTGMPTAMLRFFTVYGPRQRPDLAISMFLAKVAAGEPIDVFGDGSTSRDYTYIDDIVAGVLAAYERIDRHGYRVWNLGGNQPVTLSTMVETIGKVVGREPVVRRKPMQPGDVDRTCADLSRSGRELGYAPATGFEEGVRRQWEAVAAGAAR
jgi:UDP-glucuronate 4-epimerase